MSLEISPASAGVSSPDATAASTAETVLAAILRANDRRQRERHGSILAWRQNTIHAEPKRRHVAVHRQINGLLRQGGGLTVEQVFQCKRGRVARASRLPGRVARLPLPETPVLLLRLLLQDQQPLA